ncbi:TPA: hypothetical protein DCG35_09650 [Candidatus Edwardsbacteria bacterium]|nr:hypothetical protein [Candidatus Edwardsbacteria bacterium]HBZ86505.1 hypothetical protein [Candidatus Edwardsbacteria bacterium]
MPRAPWRREVLPEPRFPVRKPIPLGNGLRFLRRILSGRGFPQEFRHRPPGTRPSPTGPG